VTGFGLLGHAFEMINGTGKGIVINASDVPILPEALNFAKMGIIPGGTYRNREFRIDRLDLDPKLSIYITDVFFDPQTSGGLLIAVPEKKAYELEKRLIGEGIKEAAIIGEVVNNPRERISIQ